MSDTIKTVDVSRTVFIRQTLDVIDTYQEKFGVLPSTIRMRKPFYDRVQAEFEAMTGKRSGISIIQGVAIEKMALIYHNDLEVL